MTAEGRVATIFGLDNEGWARHANPWSGWTRFITCLPLFVLAIWSRTWFGWWALVLIALALAWIWINPRAFGPAKDDSSWITKGVLGEKFWASRKSAPIPSKHERIPHLLNLLAALGLPFLVWGLATLQAWPTMYGTSIVIIGKLWYIDRMSLLYRDITAARPDLRYSG